MLDATDIAELQVMLREVRDLLREQRDVLRRAVELLEMAHPHHDLTRSVTILPSGTVTR